MRPLFWLLRSRFNDHSRSRWIGITWHILVGASLHTRNGSFRYRSIGYKDSDATNSVSVSNSTRMKHCRSSKTKQKSGAGFGRSARSFGSHIRDKVPMTSLYWPKELCTSCAEGYIVILGSRSSLIFSWLLHFLANSFNRRPEPSRGSFWKLSWSHGANSRPSVRPFL